MFPRLVVSSRHPFAPSALPDFLATMGVSDFRQPPPSSSFSRPVRGCAPPGAPIGGSPWLPHILHVRLDTTSDPGVSPLALAIARQGLLPTGCGTPSARPNVAVFGTPRLQGQHHLLPLHLASFRTYASSALLPRHLQGSIPGLRLSVTWMGLVPIRIRGLARPQPRARLSSQWGPQRN